MNESVVSKITSDKEAFDFIKNHLLKQNEKADNGAGLCVYATHLNRTRTETYSQAVEDIKNSSDSTENDEYIEEIQEKLLEEIDYNSFCAIGCLFSIDKNFIRTEVGLLEGLLIGQENSAVLEGIEKLHPEWFITNDSVSMLKTFQFIHDYKEPTEWNDIISSIEGCFTNDKSPEFIARNIVRTEYGDQINNYVNRV